MPVNFLTHAAMPGNALTGKLSGPFPRVAVVNSYGGGGCVPASTPATFARYDLIITANRSVDPTTLRAAAPGSLILFYLNITQIQVNTVTAGVPGNGIVPYPGWWLTNAGTTLSVAALSGDTSIQCGVPTSQGVGSYTITNGGSGYTSAPTVTLSGGGFSRTATATAQLIGGVVTSVTVSDTGAGYLTVPTVAFSGGGGSAAAATAVLTTWPATPFPIVVSSLDRTTHEVMVVTGTPSLSGSTYTLNVTRGNWNSTAFAFSIGARVGAIAAVPNFTTDFYANISPYCTKSGSGQRWLDYAASLVQSTMATFPDYDGVFLDSANTYLNPSVANADADMNNLVDQVGGDGPSPGGLTTTTAGVFVANGTSHGIQEGIKLSMQRMRNPSLTPPYTPGTPPFVIMTNGSGYPPYSDGMFHENWTKTFFSAPPVPFNHQHRFQNMINVTGQDVNLFPATIINSTIWDNGTSAVTGTTVNAYSYSFQTIRFALAATSMGNGYCEVNWWTTFHGQTWWFDEFDGAQGTALTAAVLTTDTALTVVSSTPFTIGDVIRVPHAVNGPTSGYTTNAEDETMTVTAKPDATHLTVTRSNTVKGTQITRTAVRTDAQIAAGQGWLGQAKGGPVNNLAHMGSALLTDDFEAPSVPLGTVVAQSPTNWTFTATVAGIPAQGAVFGDATTSVTGTQSVMINTYVPTINNLGAVTYFNVKLQRTVTTTVTNGNPMTVLFWAKGDRNQTMSLQINNSGGTRIFSQQFYLTSTWAQYSLSYIAPAGDTALQLQFQVSGESGRYWFDAVAVYNGDINIWYRDFDNGVVILNGTNNNTNDTTHGQSASWKLPAVTNNPGQSFTGYKRLTGSQDPTTNSGATETPGATISIPSLDGLFLKKV